MHARASLVHLADEKPNMITALQQKTIVCLCFWTSLQEYRQWQILLVHSGRLKMNTIILVGGREGS